MCKIYIIHFPNISPATSAPTYKIAMIAKTTVDVFHHRIDVSIRSSSPPDVINKIHAIKTIKNVCNAKRPRNHLNTLIIATKLTRPDVVVAPY